MGVNYSFYVKTIENHAREFLTLNILAIGRVPLNKLPWSHLWFVTTDPQRLIELDVGRSSEFKCDAQSNPPAKLEWLQKLPTLELKDQRSQVYSRGLGKSLILRNVSYEHEGMWACTATTVIKGMYFFFGYLYIL